MEARYAGSSGDKALANVLVGEVNPTGKLAMTFPESDSDLPHPVIPALSPEDKGAGSGTVNDRAQGGSKYTVHYDEGLKVGGTTPSTRSPCSHSGSGSHTRPTPIPT